jgi:hypothetical protein
MLTVNLRQDLSLHSKRQIKPWFSLDLNFKLKFGNRKPPCEPKPKPKPTVSLSLNQSLSQAFA